jgi:hypothetical protein
VARCTNERLAREMAIAGATAPQKKPRTTVADAGGQCPADLLERDFTALALQPLGRRHRLCAYGLWFRLYRVTDLSPARSSAGRSRITCARA